MWVQVAWGLLVLMVIAALVIAIVALVNKGKTGPRGRRGPAGDSSSSSSSSFEPLTLSYYLSIEDFIQSFVEIPTSNVIGPPTGTTVGSSYLSGRASLYNSANDQKVGQCAASFLNIQNNVDIFTQILNYIATVDGLIIFWATPTTLVNLALDSIINGMVTEAIVKVTTKVGGSLYYGQTFNMVVSSDGTYIHFVLDRIE